jgi:hypothetical protein
MSKKYFAKFDAHLKAVDGVNQQTIVGGCLTLVSTILVVVLLFSEISLFLKVDVVSRMIADTSASMESVKLVYDIEFYRVPCQQLSFMQEVTRGAVHFPSMTESTEMEKIAISTDDSPDGCRLKGHIITDKVGGNFRFGISKPEHLQNPAEIQPIPAMADEFELYGNVSHRINHIIFEPTTGNSAVDKIPGLSHSLSEQYLIAQNDIAIYQYAIQVVPTQYKTLYGELSYANQYSVIEKGISIEQYSTHPPVLSGVMLRDFQGLFFSYDFHPVMLHMEEDREHMVDFISNLFGIVGGVITVLTMFEGVVHQSSKALIGKKD